MSSAGCGLVQAEAAALKHAKEVQQRAAQQELDQQHEDIDKLATELMAAEAADQAARSKASRFAPVACAPPCRRPRVA